MKICALKKTSQILAEMDNKENEGIHGWKRKRNSSSADDQANRTTFLRATRHLCDQNQACSDEEIKRDPYHVNKQTRT